MPVRKYFHSHIILAFTVQIKKLKDAQRRGGTEARQKQELNIFSERLRI